MYLEDAHGGIHHVITGKSKIRLIAATVRSLPAHLVACYFHIHRALLVPLLLARVPSFDDDFYSALSVHYQYRISPVSVQNQFSVSAVPVM